MASKEIERREAVIAVRLIQRAKTNKVHSYWPQIQWLPHPLLVRGSI